MRDQKHKKMRRLAAIITAALVLALVALQPNVASERQDSYLQRTAFCLNLLFSDPIAHAAQCAGTPNVGLETLASPGPGDPASPGPATTSDEPCPPNGGGQAGGGQIGNAGIVGGGSIGGGGDGDCVDVSHHRLAPFIADVFAQFAMAGKPAVIDETAVGTDAG